MGNIMDEDDYEGVNFYDEGSDIDNWETEQVFQDHEEEDDEEEEDNLTKAENKFAKAEDFLADLIKMMEIERH
jgi:hypothetical protein